jgi:hypothetical protein
MVKRSIYQREKSGGTDPVTLGNLRRELMNTLDTHGDVDPIYKQARKLFTDESDVIKASEQGAKWHLMKPDQVEDYIGSLSTQAERESFMSGVVNNILERSAKTEGTTRNAIKTLTGPEGSEKLSKMVTDPAEHEDMINALNLVSKYAGLADVMGRPSGIRLGSDAAMQEALQSSGAVAGIGSGLPAPGILNALSRAVRGHALKSDEDVKNAVIQMLTDYPSYAVPEIERLTKPGAIDYLKSIAEKRLPGVTGTVTGLEEPSYQPEE